MYGGLDTEIIKKQREFRYKSCLQVYSHYLTNL